MKKCRITVMKVIEHTDLMERYENPMLHACDLREGQVFIANGWEKPEGFCQSAWDTLSPFVLALSHGGQNFYDGWMKNPKSSTANRPWDKTRAAPTITWPPVLACKLRPSNR